MDLLCPSHQVTNINAQGKVSDARCKEAGAHPVPMDHSGNTGPGREQRECGEEGREKNDLLAQSAATFSVPGKNLTRLPPDQGTWALQGEREEWWSLL